MNFRESLKVNFNNSIEEYDEKVALAVYMAILDVKPENKEEEKRQMYLLDRVNYFIHLDDNLKDFIRKKKSEIER